MTCLILSLLACFEVLAFALSILISYTQSRSNILKPDSNKDGEVGQFGYRIQDPKVTTTYSSPLLYKKIVVQTNALVCTTNLSMFGYSTHVVLYDTTDFFENHW